MTERVIGGKYPVTPDGRYFVVRERLWRMSNPALSDEEHRRLIGFLMDARRAISSAKRAGDRLAEKNAREVVDKSKQGLGERGPVWWDDGAPDFNRHLVCNSPYADWYVSLK